MHEVYLAKPQTDLFRWVTSTNDEDGRRLTAVRLNAVSASWVPMRVEWIPETAGRALCDFPIFHPFVKCISRRAADVLAEYLSGNVELLTLQGLAHQYVGYHCINWVDAINLSGVDVKKISINSTLFVPRVSRRKAERHAVFGLPETPTKLFVSQQFKEAYDSEQLTGLDFVEVELTDSV
jgi:hypothetical protein